MQTSAQGPAVDHESKAPKGDDKGGTGDEQQRVQAEAEAASERRLSQTLPAPQLKSLLTQSGWHGTPRAQTPGRVGIGRLGTPPGGSSSSSSSRSPR